MLNPKHRNEQINMPECSNCGSHVTSTFVRVFAVDENNIHGCPSCMTYAEISDGESAGEP